MTDNSTFKVGIYMRLSRDDLETEESESINNQRSYIMDYVKENNLVVVDSYIDRNISGITFDRPDFNRMIKDIENKRINMVITKDLSRLGREMSESIYYVEKYFPEKRIRYVAINDSIDTFIDCVGNEMIGFKAVFNEYYAKDISKKIKSSLNTKKKQGKFLGAHAPYGYMKDPRDKYHLIIDPVASEVVQKIYGMFIEGNSLQRIARYLTACRIPRPSVHKGMDYKNSQKTKNIWDVRTVDDILKNPNYTGDLVQCRRKKISHKSKKIINVPRENWIVIENTHEPIISKETYELVQDIYKKNKKIDFEKPNLLLRGFLYCKECGHRIGINTSMDKKRHYTVCNHYRKFSSHNFCTVHSMRYEMLEKAVLKEVRGLCSSYIDREHFESVISNHDKKSQMVTSLENRIKKLKEEIHDSQEKISKVYSDRLDEIITLDMYQSVTKQIADSITKNRSLLEKFELEKDSYNSGEMISIGKWRKLIEDFLSLKKPSRNLLARLIEKIAIDEQKNVEIHYKIKV